MSTMYGFPVGFSCPEFIMADQNDLYPVYSTNFKKLGKSTYFTFIGTK